MIQKYDIIFNWAMLAFTTTSIMIANEFTGIPGFIKIILALQFLITVYANIQYMKQQRK